MNLDEMLLTDVSKLSERPAADGLGLRADIKRAIFFLGNARFSVCWLAASVQAQTCNGSLCAGTSSMLTGSLL